MISSNRNFEVLDELVTDWHEIYNDEVSPVRFRVKTIKFGIDDYVNYEVICEDNLEIEDYVIQPKFGLDANVNLLSKELFKDINSYYDDIEEGVLDKIKEEVKLVLTEVIETIEEDKKV